MSTPLQEQYNQIKKRYPESMVLIRMGDFYEVFNEDAQKAAKILGIALTSRSKGTNPTPMAGVPHHALKNYLPKLVEAGCKVVIVDQVGEVTPGRLVEREVTEIITPGAIIDENLLNENRNNYLACVFLQEVKKEINCTVVMVDVGTGDTTAFTIDSLDPELTTLRDELTKYNVKELVINEKAFNSFKQYFTVNYFPFVEVFNTVPDADFDKEDALKDLRSVYEINSLKSWGINDDTPLVGTINALRRYLQESLQKDLDINRLSVRKQAAKINIPWNTYRALEVFSDSQGQTTNSLYTHLDQTNTAGGRRKLYDWLVNIPLDPALIENRLDNVDKILQQISSISTAEAYENFLKSQADYERFLVKFKYNRLRPNDLYNLGSSVQAFGEFLNFTKSNKLDEFPLLKELRKLNDKELLALADEYLSAINPGVIDTSNPGFINPEYDSELNELVTQATSGSDFLQNMERQEVQNTGITSLKIRYNKVFGYYIEISKTNLSKVPAHYIRKQTLVNAERYITDELKKWEEKILNITEVRLAMEQRILKNLIEKFEPHTELISKLGSLIAEFDILHGFALLAKENGYVKPQFSQAKDPKINIHELKHPILAKRLGENFIANDLVVGHKNKFQIITGPNMAGKSTYIRSIAILQLMAQLGSFVPANKAELKIVDGIYSRVGASDNLSQNESTFMVEMIEMGYIVKHATKDSLIILDEVGRGTSTYDGISLAWSFVEYISQKLKTICLFATHYHELTVLEQTLEGVKNYFVEVIPREKLFFTHKVKEGSLNKSFGVAVAKMAGIDKNIIGRANEILLVLEQENDRRHLAKKDLNYSQLGLLAAQQSINNVEQLTDEDKEKIAKYEQISKLDFNNITPLEALNQIHKILK